MLKIDQIPDLNVFRVAFLNAHHGNLMICLPITYILYPNVIFLKMDQ